MLYVLKGQGKAGSVLHMCYITHFVNKNKPRDYKWL